MSQVIKLRQRACREEHGFSIVLVLAIGVVFITLGTILAQLAVSNIAFDLHEQRSLAAQNIAEAGVNYYMWHLSHNTTDYCDGGPTCSGAGPFGPYVHDYYDANNTKIGTFTLTITPPPSGSTITTVQSVGRVTGLNSSRTILAQLGIPSFASYIFLSNSELDFSSTATTTGPVHSNVGIDFEGANNGPVTAANSTYVSQVDGNSHNGVWGGGGPQSQWQFPVPAINFNQVTVDLSALSTLAQASGGVYLNNSGGIGFYLNLKSNGTIDVYKVRSQNSAGITTTFIRNQAAPTNGIVFSTENLWIAGTSWSKRTTIAAAKLPDSPANRRSINIINNITYAAKDGTDVLGLVAQQDIFLPQYVPNTMEIDAALLAQNGSIGYDTSNGGVKTQFTLYGSLEQNQNAYGFKVVGCGSYCSGFPTTVYGFDTNLTYAPPPSYPTTGAYQILNWRELLSGP